MLWDGVGLGVVGGGGGGRGGTRHTAQIHIHHN